MNGGRAGRVEFLHQSLERYVGVGECLDVGVTDASEHLVERCCRFDASSQDKCADEHSDEVVESLFAATGDRRSDGDVTGIGEAGEQDRESGVHGDERCHAVSECEPVDPSVDGRWNVEPDRGGPSGGGRGSGMIEGKFEPVGEAGKCRAPVAELCR
ncbi:hypothetical protein MLGJGCBP_02319 [Rhodococcus sp. T7]|nr:hypothetical protein MLGJGCBP_02319 [Rhodococcus sp. T7]